MIANFALAGISGIVPAKRNGGPCGPPFPVPKARITGES